MSLRPYQQKAVDDTVAYFRKGLRNPLIVLPTGAGKSRVLGAMARWATSCKPRADGSQRRVLVLAHRKELIEQDAAACRLMAPGVDVGIYCAALDKRDLTSRIIVASRDSIANVAAHLGAIDIVVIDEAHLVSTTEQTRYRKIITEIEVCRPGAQVIGLTATPYRLDQGYLTQGDGKLFDAVSCDVPMRQLIDEGYLAAIDTSVDATASINTEKVGTRAGDFKTAELELAADIDEVTIAVADDVKMALDDGRTSAMVFGVSVKHCAHLAEALAARGIKTVVVTGMTPPAEREAAIAAFKAREVNALVNMDVLTTGFDAPNVDIVAIVRPTKSVSLFVQIGGRGTRPEYALGMPLDTVAERLAAIAAGPKARGCLLLDYGGNLARHGSLDSPRVLEKKTKGEGEAPTKVCPECKREVHTGVRVCECGHEFPPPEKKANSKASKLSALKDTKPTRHEKVSTSIHLYRRKNKPHWPLMIRVDYCSPQGFVASEYFDVERHPHQLAWKGESNKVKWRKRFGVEMPDSVNDAHLVAMKALRGKRISWLLTTPSPTGFEEVTHIEYEEAV